MYDRANRQLSAPVGSTMETVGPGAYDVPVPSDIAKRKFDGYAPFGGMSMRQTFLDIQDNVIAAPGPGQYDPSPPKSNIRGSRALSNKANRFCSDATVAPGPGAYSVSRSSDWIKNSAARGLVSQQGIYPDRSLLRASSMSKVAFKRKPDPPSIPTPGQAYGYEENEDGSLKKQDGPPIDQSMGPAFYNVQDGKTKTTAKYKGVHFSSQTAKRMQFSGKDGPGPGDYELMNEGAYELYDTYMFPDGEKKYESKLPRYHEMVSFQEEKKAVPGPGKYEIHSQFEKKGPVVNTEGIQVEHPPFMSQARRFLHNKQLHPAPGAYNDPRHALEVTKRITGLKRSPFGQTSLRFSGEHPVRHNPGPAAYTKPGLAAEITRKAYLESTRRGGFGSTSLRIQPITKKSESAMPGPAHYQTKPSSPPKKLLDFGPSGNFLSQTQRLYSPPPIIKEIPPPGSYELTNAFEKTQTKISHMKPRTDSAKKKSGAFLSSSDRFEKPRNIPEASAEVDIPGPGTYDIESEVGEQKGGLMVTRGSRFRNIKNSAPGPGAYDLSPLLMDTVLTGTFNVTLNNPVTPRLEDERFGGVSTKQAFLLGV